MVFGLKWYTWLAILIAVWFVQRAWRELAFVS